ncbi:MAG: acyl-CoA thioesterase [Saprospiraceae bacterium]|nr:acyl-CoA thioesterase [Saprospiraceae bacterium]
MIISETKIRIRYADTDKMGFVYYGNYPTYYEVARTEALRELNSSYKQLEEDGISMPVHSMNIKYIKPAFYDDLITVKTFIKSRPERLMVFDYEIYNQNNELLNKATTTLPFISIETGKPCRPPEWFLKLFDGYF